MRGMGHVAGDVNGRGADHGIGLVMGLDIEK